MRCPARFGAAVALAATSLLQMSATSAAGGAQPWLPSALASFLAEEAHATPSEREALLAGNPLIKLLDADPSKEMAVLGAVWVNAPPRLYVEQVKNIEQLERGGAFRITKRISDPPSADDFAALTISDQDFEDLKDCGIGDCALKLDADGVQTLRAQVDWRKSTAKADATALFRRLALEYVNGYRQGGNARLGIHRDREHPTFVANEFRLMIDRLPRLAADLPELRRYLLEYPNATLANSTNFLYLAGNTVRTEADRAHQSPRYSGASGSDGSRVKDALRKPLLLDRARTSRPAARFGERTRILAGDDQPQPIRRLERIHRPRDSKPGAE